VPLGAGANVAGQCATLAVVGGAVANALKRAAAAPQMRVSFYVTAAHAFPAVGIVVAH